MKILLLIVAILSLGSASQSWKDIEEDRPDLLLFRYQNGYYYEQWGEYSQMFTKDCKLVGPNYPIIEGNSNWVDACIALRPTNQQLSFYGEQLNMKDNIGTITGFYQYFFTGAEEDIKEVGYFVSFLKKNQNGKWQFDRLLWNRIGSEYSISMKWLSDNIKQQ